MKLFSGKYFLERVFRDTLDYEAYLALDKEAINHYFMGNDIKEMELEIDSATKKLVKHISDILNSFGISTIIRNEGDRVEDLNFDVNNIDQDFLDERDKIKKDVIDLLAQELEKELTQEEKDLFKYILLSGTGYDFPYGFYTSTPISKFFTKYLGDEYDRYYKSSGVRFTLDDVTKIYSIIKQGKTSTENSKELLLSTVADLFNTVLSEKDLDYVFKSLSQQEISEELYIALNGSRDRFDDMSVRVWFRPQEDYEKMLKDENNGKISPEQRAQTKSLVREVTKELIKRGQNI